MSALTRWLASAVFEGDEERSRQAHLTNVVALGMLVMAVILLVTNLAGSIATSTTITVNAVAVVLFLPVNRWIHAGRLTLAQAWLLLVVFAAVTAGVASIGTIRAPVTATYLLGVAMAGLIFDRKGIVLSTLACSMAVFGLIGAEKAGLLPRPDYAVGIAQWVTYTVLFGFTGTLAYVINQISKDALHRAKVELEQRRQVEEALNKANLQLNLRVQEVQRLHEEMREQAHHDGLTGLYNRRYLKDALDREVARAQRNDSVLSFVLLDIDHFKEVNDRYGHPGGDEILVQLAHLLVNNARGSDIICRYGGEEFLLVLPDTSYELAVQFAENVRAKCAESSFKASSYIVQPTLSMGVASFPHHGQCWEEIVAKADAALYQSKRNGRNRVTGWQGSS